MSKLATPDRLVASVVPVTVLVPWLAFLSWLQRPLIPPSPELPATPPIGLVALVALASLVLRVVWPALQTHLLALAAVTAAASLAAAQIGAPLANASADYCGDFCRTAIAGRAVSFFGWPILVAGVLWLSARLDAPDRSSLSRRWALMTLLAGEVAALVWWRTILPAG